MKTHDMDAFSNQLLVKMKEQLDGIALDDPETITKATQSLGLIRAILTELKDFTIQYKFRSLAEEIKFFKEIKPVFMSQFFYFDKLLSITINEPLGDVESLKIYYSTALENLDVRKTADIEFYRYCLSSATHFDDRYFTRENSIFPGLDIDTQFSTGYDNKLAKILSSQMLRSYLMNIIRNLSSENYDPAHSTVTWTGSKTALIELMYALQSTHAFNNGKADLRQIATSFENVFHVSLGNYYKVFQEIRQRKSGQANFLEQLRNKFIQRISERD